VAHLNQADFKKNTTENNYLSLSLKEIKKKRSEKPIHDDQLKYASNNFYR